MDDLDVDVDLEVDLETGDGPDAEVTPIGRSAAGRAAEQQGEITPNRPEPFLPKRSPEHPEDPAPMAVAAAGGSAAPAAATYIERDPSVNKSLLLRLIAGVRGL